MKWAALAVVATTGAADAALITFEFTGTGSGTLDGVAFGPSSYTITAVGDTTVREFQAPDVYWIDHSSASIEIEGLGSMVFLTPTRTFVTQEIQLVGLARAGEFGPDLIEGPENPIFSTWDMLSSVPLVSGPGVLLQWALDPVSTDHGTLEFFDQEGMGTTFQAVIPAPGAMTGIAAAALVAARRRRAVR